jgi:hypothetical protein
MAEAVRIPGMSADKPTRDEDEKLDAEEIADVADETPTDVTPPEVDPRTKELTAWDDAPADHGSAAPKVGPAVEDDEDTIAADLVYEGTDEADRELRLAAIDPDFEP